MIIIRKVLYIQDKARLATQYENDAYRLYLVKCVQWGDLSKCNEFFKIMSATTQNNPAWTEWFSILVFRTGVHFRCCHLALLLFKLYTIYEFPAKLYSKDGYCIFFFLLQYLGFIHGEIHIYIHTYIYI
uniref:Pentatricopeptide repeat-containing protein n=1 Tax=Heterorhabditis bacteriophora TaxID=37862 RepID=A0A1I7X9B2_HETBA